MLKLKPQLVAINSVIVLAILIFSTLVTVNLFNSSINDISERVNREINQTLQQNTIKAAEITQNIISDTFGKLLRDAKILADSTLLFNLVTQGVMPRGQLEQTNDGFVQRYRKARPLIDFQLVVGKLKADHFYSQNASTHIELYGKNGKLLAATARIPAYLVEQDSSKITQMLNTHSGYLDNVNVVISDQGLSLKVYQKLSETDGIIGLSIPLDLNFLQKIKGITNADALIFRESEFVDGTIFKFGATTGHYRMSPQTEIFEEIKQTKDIIITGSDKFPDKQLDLGFIDQDKLIANYRFAFLPLTNISGDVVGMLGIGISTATIEIALTNFQAEREEIGNQIIVIFIIITGLSLIIAVTLIYFHASAITGSISKILSIVSLVSKGELKRSIEMNRTDEIGELSDGINHMVKTIRQSQEQLKVERDFSVNIVAGAPYLICRINNQGRITFINPAGENLSGYRLAELADKYYWDLFDFKRSGITSEDLLTSLGEDYPPDLEIILTCQNGEQKSIIWNCFTTSDSTNNTKELIGFGYDITIQKQAVQELQFLQNYLSNIIDSMPSVLVCVDQNGKITQWNQLAEQTTKLSADAALGRSFKNVFPDLRIDDSRIQTSIQTKEVFEEQSKKRETELGIVYENVTVYPLISDETEGAVIRIDDVTTEHKLMEQLAQSSKMDAIGQLAGGVAHDFNNMLSGILGATELLKHPQRNLDEKGHKYVGMILKAVNRASDLTSKLLAFSRKGKIVPTVLDLHQIIDETLSIFKRTIDRTIALSVQKHAQASQVFADGSAIQNVLMNLGINASHAMPAGGNLQISTRNIELNQAYCSNSPFDLTPGKHIELELRDTGQGIAEENIKKIFEPFFTTKEQGKGTGLGLAAVYGTIQEHNGAINVYSEVGKGTVFHVYLPCAAYETVQQTDDESIVKGDGTILLVDDEELIRLTGEQMLQDMGYDVLLAEDGLEALKVLRSHHDKIDLIILDMIMPRMNGRETFYKLREIDKDCKVIIASGFAKDEHLDELKQSGLAGFIDKPFRDYQLSQLINKVLSQH